MRLRMKFLAAFLLLAVIALVGGSYNQHRASAATFSCKNSQCPNDSKCNGDHFQRDGCKITCFLDQGTTGEIVYSGDASCGTSPGGGGGGGGGFGCGAMKAARAGPILTATEAPAISEVAPAKAMPSQFCCRDAPDSP